MSAQLLVDGRTENSSIKDSTDEQPLENGQNIENRSILTDEDYNLLLSELQIDKPNLEEPDYGDIWKVRMSRNLELMNRISPTIAKQVVEPKQSVDVKDLPPEAQAALCIQRHYRGFMGRKIFTQRLYEQFEKDEAERCLKQQEQVEEGELLVESHTLETEIEDCLFARKNHLRHQNYCATIIQSVWRKYKENTSDKNESIMDIKTEDLITF